MGERTRDAMGRKDSSRVLLNGDEYLYSNDRTDCIVEHGWGAYTELGSEGNEFSKHVS